MFLNKTMASDPSNTNHIHSSPPRKKTKQSKMVDTRESLGEFESSIFDASDGHKLVDLIRRKKGLHVQTQKIFDDIPAQRPSLQIEIQRLDQENETLQPERLPQEPEPAAVVNSEVPPNIEFVPKSPVRTSVARSITSPIIKMSSTTLGRRTLLKEFEKAFLHESRFNPEICSTPISSDFANEIIHTNKNGSPKEPCISEKESPEENIICSPITISDEGSPAEKTRSKSCNNERMMRSLINQNELLNALVQQSQEEEPDATFVNRDKLVIKSPRRTFTVQRDISTGTITLSPSKNEREPKKLTRKLVSTPEQRKLFSRLGLGLAKGSSNVKVQESPQKSSRIPILSKATTAVGVPPCLTNQESTTAEFVERLQKNATPNCPVIVIPVNQTFNQAPTNPTIPKDVSHLRSSPLDEITSTISDNTPKAVDYPSRQKDTHREVARVDSPVSNVISSTTISNGEQQTKGRVPEPPIGNLRWDDIITDDASSSDASNCSTRSSGLQNERKKKSKKQHSAAYEKKKSLSYKCLDLRLRVDSDEEREKKLPQKSKPLASEIGEQRLTDKTNNLPHRSRQGASRIGERYEEEREHNLQQRSRRDPPKVDEQRYEERVNYLQQRSRRGASKIDEEDCEHNSHQRSRRRNSKIAEQCDDDREHNLPHRSRRESSKVENHLQQLSRRTASKIDKQLDEDCEQDLPQRSRRVTSRMAEHFDEEHEQTLPLRSRREDPKNNKQSNEDSESSLPRQESIETDEQCDGERQQNSSNRSQCKISHIDKQRDEVYTSVLPQQSRREGSEIDKQRDKERENNLRLSPRRRTSKIFEEHENNLPQRTRRETSAFDNQCDEELENNPSQRTEQEPSEIDEQPIKQLKNILPRPSRSKNNKQRSENHEQNFNQRLRQATLDVDDKLRKECENNLQLQSQQKTTNIVEQCNRDLERSLPRRSRRDISKIDEQISILRQTIHGNNEVESFQKLPPPPDEFRDIDSLSTNSISLGRDLVDEDSSERIVLSQDKFKRPFEAIKKKKGRKQKIVPENVKEYLEANQKVAKTRHLNISKRKLYSKGNSDLDSSDDSSFSRMPPKRDKSLTTPQKPPCRSRKSGRFSKSKTNRNADSKQDHTAKEIFRQESNLNSHQKQPSVTPLKTRNTPRHVAEYSSKAIDIKVNNKELKQKRVSRSRWKGNRSTSISDYERTSRQSNENSARVNNNDTESNVDENVSARSSRSTTRTAKITKNSRQTNKREPRFVNKDVENKVSNEILARSLLAGGRGSSSSTDNEINSKQSKQLSTRECHSAIESNQGQTISATSSRSRSPPKISTPRKSNIERNPRKTNEKISKQSNQLSTGESHSTIQSNQSPASSRSCSLPEISTPRKSNIERNSMKTNEKTSKQSNQLSTRERHSTIESNQSPSSSRSRSPPKISTPRKTSIERNSMKTNEKTSKQSNQLSTRERHSTIESNQSPASSRSRSPPKISTPRKSNMGRNSRKIHESKTKSNDKYVESNLEEDIPAHPSKSRSLSKKTGASPSKQTKKPSKQSNANAQCNEDVEGNVEKDTRVPPSKSRTKKKISKKINDITTSLPCVDITSLEQSDCGPRRSKREKKQPTAYWACDSQYTHVYDIYNMLTAGKKPYFPEYLMNPKAKKKNKLKLPSTDDNLVANTNTVDSSSEKVKNKTKQQSKEKNKKIGEPKTIENRELQSDSEPSQLSELSTIEKPASSVQAEGKTSSRPKSKSKQKTKEKLNFKALANANSSEKDTDINDSKSSDSNAKKRRLTTITETGQMVFNNQRTTSIVDVMDNNPRASSGLMPPPKTNVVKKVNKTSKSNAFHTEHDESIADVSSVHVNNLFDQLKNSSMNNTTVNRSRLPMNSSGQVSLDSRSSKKRNPSNSVEKTKNISVRLQRLNLHAEGTQDKHFDSGFSSEDMNSINTKKDILLDWLVKMLNNGKSPSSKQRGLARFLQPNGFSIANADELTFEEIDGVDFAFYNTPGQKFGYLRFNPRTQKKLSCAKRYELNFVLLGGTIQMTVDRQTFDMRNGDLITIFIGTYYLMKNITDDPALVMVIRN